MSIISLHTYIAKVLAVRRYCRGACTYAYTYLI